MHKTHARRTFLAVTLLLAAAAGATAQTLQSFGKDVWRTPTRWPTLVVLVDFEPYDPPPSVSFWHDYVFNPARSPEGVNRYFQESSMGSLLLSTGATIRISVPAPWPAGGVAFYSNLVYQAMASGQYDFAINDVNPHDGKVTENELLVLFLLDQGGGQKAWAGRVQSTNSTVAFEGSVCSAPLQEWALPGMCHELCHLMKAKDLYGIWGTDQDINNGLSIMSGNLVYPDAWLKLRFGWISPRIQRLETGGYVDIPVAQASAADAPVILYDAVRGPREYFLLEYRSTNTSAGVGCDRDLPDAGLLIWHVYHDASTNAVPYCTVVYPSAEGDWYECSGCRSLVARSALGVKTCPGITNHGPQVVASDGSPADMHTLDKNMTGSVWGGTWEDQWRKCSRCGVLFYGPNQASSRCSYGGTHDATGSLNYSLRRNTREPVGHNGWARCTQCQSLGYTVVSSALNRWNLGCAAASGGAHVWGADRYVLNAAWSDLTMLTRSPPDLLYGSNALWRAGAWTPPLTWYDGSYTATRLRVLPFAPADTSIRVEWITAGDTWVDFSYGGAELGTFDNPYNTFNEGLAAVPNGGTLHVKAGTSPETAYISKRVVIRSHGGTATIGR